ncbi:2-dehydropantoate 2-reductase [Desulfarculus baarsii DSM 2075]|uniref:2-dehydropantoate 2-reductase n=1 Tax=Desulfarculus baarsii (strain ATCC 33931 / DSM 2075 / LMG 7858 / VKM B-1802 / 2st14) TaxID=644282 RepID=E1QIW8_DESB2|nr:2-dehydropantoate 2-reductase [Desulfarculus baarsii]ADK85511.1 2-dehydropantoate 2-reductase [Desulfarculus baarsii DSM 2075]
MLTSESPTAVIGAGAIGGITAALMAKAGRNVELVCKHSQTTDRALYPGLRLRGVCGEHEVRMQAVTNIGELSSPKDIVFLATKANDCLTAARQLAPFLTDDGVVVSLQNGISEDALGEILGRGRVIGCVVGWGATMHEPGELEMTSEGEFVLGNIDAQPDERLPIIKSFLEFARPTRISDNIMGELYSKLIVNSCINSLGAISGWPLGQLLKSWRVRSIFIAQMREAMAVAAAMKLKVEPGGGGKLDYYRFVKGNGPLAILKRHLYVKAIGTKYARIKSSSLQSLQRGRPTEVDYLNGYIVEKGKAFGVATPVNEAIVRMIKQIEEGSRRITPDNIAELPLA